MYSTFTAFWGPVIKYKGGGVEGWMRNLENFPGPPPLVFNK